MPDFSRNLTHMALIILFFYLASFSLAQDASSASPSSETSVSAADAPKSSQTSAPLPSTSKSQDARSGSTVADKPSTTSSAPAQTHTITVGNADHKFRPDVVQAEAGDIIEFEFYPQNHSVVRAEYQYPCIPYEMTGVGKVGFFSGFHPVDAVLDKPPTYSLRINDTKPIFFYCSAPGSCITYGMVGVINPNASTSLNKQRDMAMDSAYMLNPGEPFPAESPLPSNIPSDAPKAPSSSKHGLTSGAIAGITIACVSVVVLGSLLFFFWGRLKSLKEELVRKDSTIKHHEPQSPMAMFHHFHPGAAPAPSAYSPSQHPHDPDTSTAPAYFNSPKWSATPPPGHTSPTPYYPRSHSGPFNPSTTTTTTLGNVNRSASIRSVGGTFDISPTTGYYTRTHEGREMYKYNAPHTSDMTSPVDPTLIPTGIYGRQLHDLKAMNQGSGLPSERPAPGYFETVTGRPRTFHLNQGEMPAEMDDTSPNLANVKV